MPDRIRRSVGEVTNWANARVGCGLGACYFPEVTGDRREAAQNSTAFSPRKNAVTAENSRAYFAPKKAQTPENARAYFARIYARTV